MKILAVFCFIICLFILAIAKVIASPEEDAIAKTIADSAKAMTDFPKTRDVRSVLRLYAKDYMGINNGESETLMEVEKVLTDLEEKINLGKPVGIVDRVSNVKVQVTGTLGWATYDEVMKIGAGGEVLVDLQAKCTGIYKKKGMEWLVQHVHCSTPHMEKGNPPEESTE